MITIDKKPANLMFSRWTSDTQNTPFVRPAGTKGIKIALETHTDGGGYWSREQRKVDIVKVVIDKLWYSQGFRAELQVFFRKSDWDVAKHGLIYTDRNWLKQFKDHLINMGFSQTAVNAIDYSEQGMQGDNYVSLDVGDAFIREFALIFCFGNRIDKHGFIL